MEKILLTFALFIMSALIGFLAQRSRMCFIAGFRDYFLLRDKELLWGFFSFLLTVWFLTSLFYSIDILRTGIPEYGDIIVQKSVTQIKFAIYNLRGVRELFGENGNGPDSISIHFMHRFIYVTFFGGLLIGMLSTLSDGCVLRQHVLFAQGNMNAAYFLLGFYVAVVVYYGLLFKFFIKLY